MKTTNTFSAASVLLISLIAISLFKIGLAVALTDATSTAASTSTTPAVATGTSTPATSQTTTLAAPAASLPSLKLIHVVGTKYVDYFTDGTKTYSFPGDPAVDGNLNKPNAPIPTHAGLTWVSTSGMEAYDTPSGDLELGDYAQEADGSYISNVPAYTYTDATSSMQIAAHIAMSKSDPTVAAVTTSTPPPAASTATTTATTPAPSASTSTTPATGTSSTSTTQ